MSKNALDVLNYLNSSLSNYHDNEQMIVYSIIYN